MQIEIEIAGIKTNRPILWLLSFVRREHFREEMSADFHPSTFSTSFYFLHDKFCSSKVKEEIGRVGNLIRITCWRKITENNFSVATIILSERILILLITSG